MSKVAMELHLSVKTIETHQMRMKQKLGANSAAELQARAENWLRATEGFRRGR
ncbi:MAG: LuxR C-terminal-related transcriptional regulator [Chthoniobacterales bacterium]